MHAEDVKMCSVDSDKFVTTVSGLPSHGQSTEDIAKRKIAMTQSHGLYMA